MAHKLKSFGAFLHKHRLAATVFVVAASFIFARFAFAVDIATIYTLFPSMLMTALGLIYNVLAWAIGQLIVLLIGMVLIPILGYNGFADANIISIGWPLIRDVMNMGVILILLWIAIRTMLGIGGGAAGAQQSLVRLFAGVVALNFSRTICIIIIDASQVVMFTFVNALRDIAAGNFAALFNLNAFLEVTVDGFSDAFSSGGVELGLESFGYLGSAYATVMLLAAVLGVMVLLAGVFVYRIVLLWILVILSPIALFFKAAGPLIPGGTKAIGRWSTMFTGAVTLGPILAFFLWLALAAAGGGGLATTEGFPSTGTDDITGLLNDVFEVDEIMSLLLGLVLLVIGLQVATSAASSMGGVADKAFGANGYAMKWVKGAVTLPARGTYIAGREAVRQYDRSREARGLSTFGGQVGTELQTFGNTITENIPAFGRLGSIVADQGSKIAGLSSESRKQAQKVADDYVTNAGDRTVKDYVSMMTNPELLASQPNSVRDRVLRATALTFSDKGKKKAFLDTAKADLIAQGMSEDDAKAEAKMQLERSQQAFVQMAYDNPDMAIGPDKAAQDAFKKSLLSHLDKLTTKQLEEVMKDAEDDGTLANISANSLKDKRVQDILANIDGQRIYDPATQTYTTQSLLDQWKSGVGTTREKRDALQGKGAEFGPTPAKVLNAAQGATEAERTQHATENHIRHMASAIEFEHLNVQTLTAADLKDASGNSIVRKHATALVESGASLAGLSDTVRKDISTEFVKMASDISSKLTTATGDELKGLQSEMRRIRKAQFSIAKMDPAGTSIPATVMTALARMGVNGTGKIRDDAREVVREVIQKQPEQIYKMRVQIDAGASSSGNDLTKEIAKTIDTKAIRKMQTKVEALQSSMPSNPTTQADIDKANELKREIGRIKASAVAIRKALETEIAQVTSTMPTAGGGTKQTAPRDITSKLDAIKLVERYS